jgi:ABC-2 type transport system permease protein
MAKELRLYFTSPIAYVVSAVFLTVMGYLFYTIVLFASNQSMIMMRMQGALPRLNVNEMVMRPVLNNMAIILLFTLPLLTMRLWAEEKKLKTAELLMTSPVTVTELVLGKYLAAFTVYLGMLGMSLFMPISLSFMSQIQWPAVLTAYGGLALLGGVFLSVGLLGSSLTENQVIAAFLGFGMLLLLWLTGWAAQVAGDGSVGRLLSYLSVGEHFQNAVTGLVDTRDLVYQFSVIAVSLFLTHRVVEAQRWK